VEREILPGARDELTGAAGLEIGHGADQGAGRLVDLMAVMGEQDRHLHVGRIARTR
jgi:hypothetical protein